MLRNWRFDRANKAWDRSIFVLVNCQVFDDEFLPESLVERDGGFEYQRGMARAETIDFRPLVLPVIRGMSGTSPSLTEPVGGRYIADASLKYAGMYLLSSLVRYRPQTWVHSVARMDTVERPADDAALSLVEYFMGSAQSTFVALANRLLTKT